MPAVCKPGEIPNPFGAGCLPDVTSISKKKRPAKAKRRRGRVKKKRAPRKRAADSAAKSSFEKCAPKKGYEAIRLPNNLGPIKISCLYIPINPKGPSPKGRPKRKPTIPSRLGGRPGQSKGRTKTEKRPPKAPTVGDNKSSAKECKPKKGYEPLRLPGNLGCVYISDKFKDLSPKGK